MPGPFVEIEAMVMHAGNIPLQLLRCTSGREQVLKSAQACLFMFFVKFCA